MTVSQYPTLSVMSEEDGHRVTMVCTCRCSIVSHTQHDEFTCSILDMSQGRAPLCASSTIFCLVESGKGLPFTNTPPSWFTPL